MILYIIGAIEALQSAAPLKIILPLISLAFLSPLNEFFRQVNCEPAFVMYLLGKTPSRKSTLAALILSFFGKFTSSGLSMNFKDTSNALEKKCFILKDVLTVIDDFHPVFSAADKTAMMQKMQSIARGYGNRCGRSRLRSDMTIIYCPLLQTTQLFAMPPTAAMQAKGLHGQHERLRWRLRHHPAERGISKPPLRF